MLLGGGGVTLRVGAVEGRAAGQENGLSQLREADVSWE